MISAHIMLAGVRVYVNEDVWMSVNKTNVTCDVRRCTCRGDARFLAPKALSFSSREVKLVEDSNVYLNISS